jgi:MFS family permease
MIARLPTATRLAFRHADERLAVEPLRRNREFVALWAGQAVSNLGISISSFAYPLLVLEATGSPVKAGLVGSILAGTAFFLRLPAGVLVDRWNRRAILLACDAGRALNAAAFATALALGHFFYVQVLVVAVVEASLGVLFGPAETAAVRRVVPPSQLREAVAQNQSRSAIPGLVGPPLGGVLLAVSRALPFVADAISYLVSLACIASVRTPLGGGGRREGRAVAGVLDGLRWIWERRFLRSLLFWFLGVGLVFNSVGLVTLVFARDHGASSQELGAMFAIVSAGAAAGALLTPMLLRRVQPRTLLVTFAWSAAGATFLLLTVRSPYLIGLLGALAFVLVPAVNALAFAAVAEEADDELQGRVTSAAIQIGSLAAPVGPVVAGVLLGALSVSTVVAAYGSALVLLALVVTAAGAFRS